MNASVHLLRRVVPATVHIQADIPEDHVSTAILGAERMGTGVVLGAGAIVTAHYVLIGARSVQVTAIDGTSVAGQIVGIDYQSGLGVVAASGFPARGLTLRSPEDPVAVGEECFVVASVGEGRQVRTGFVASIGPFDAFWEYMIDRAILASPENPGLGGGPLVDLQGRVLGIAALSLAEVGRATFAIPSELVTPILESIRETGRYVAAVPRPWLGLTCYALRNHVVVAGVIPGSPAADAGVKSGDLILAIDGAEVGERRELFERLWRRSSGDPVRLRLFRDDSTVELEVATSSVEAFFGDPSA